MLLKYSKHKKNRNNDDHRLFTQQFITRNIRDRLKIFQLKTDVEINI